MFRFIFTSLATASLIVLIFLLLPRANKLAPDTPVPLWEIRSVDTMKYSRDLAREKLDDQDFDSVISNSISLVVGVGATHVGLATPYDPEFIPFLKRWVEEARKNDLKIWFRGNLSGWEEWFDYPKLSRLEHTRRVVEFIRVNPELFQDGDLFSACPECENGGPGDPRMTGGVESYREFLITEHEATTQAFHDIGVEVDVRMNSMNYDVAALVMDKATTQALGGLVVVDHYVRDPIRLARDLREIALRSGGSVFLGEFGAPIPDIHGQMTRLEQAKWLEQALIALSQVQELRGLNYWVGVGGSTALWEEDGTPYPGSETLRSFYTKLTLPK